MRLSNLLIPDTTDKRWQMGRTKRFGELQTELFAFNAAAPFVTPKGLGPLMGTSWFSMSKSPRFAPIKHEYKNYWVEIHASPEGMATYWDQDILLFAVSQLISAHKRGEDISPVVRFTGNDYFQFTRQKWVGGLSYKALVKSMRRLQGTTIRTNIKPNESLQHAEQGEGWIVRYRTLYEKSKQAGFEITLPQHVFEWAQNKHNWLTLDSSYFDLMGGMERFLYLWGRKATGYTNGDRWEESFNSLYEKSASTAAPTKFRYNLGQIIKRQSIVGYNLDEYTCPKRGRVLMLERDLNHPLLLKPFGKIRRPKASKNQKTDNQLAWDL